jgi:O-antigen/teichoic acid export membrane protein
MLVLEIMASINYIGCMSLTRKVAYNTIVQIVGRVITTATSLVLVASLTRYLGVSGFGSYTTIFAYTAFLAVLADFGFFNVLVREIATKQREQEKVLSNIFSVRILFALAVYAVGLIIAFFIGSYSIEIKYGIAIITIAQFWLTLNSTLVGVFQAHLRMDKAVITDVLGRIVTLIFVLLAISAKLSLLAIISAYIIGNLINLVLSVAIASQYIKLRLSWDYSYWRYLAKITVPMGLLTIVGWVYFHADMVILSLLRDEYEVGIYGASYKIMEILLALPAIFTGAIFPIFSRYFVEKNKRLSSIFQQSFNFLVIACIPLAIIIFMLAKPIISFIAGGQFIAASAPGLLFWGQPATAVLTLQILVFALVLSFISHLFRMAVIAIGEQGKLAISTVVLMVINIVLNLVFVPRYSYLAAATITVLGEFLILLFPIMIIAKSGIRLPSLTLFPKILLSSVFMVGVILVFDSLSLIPLAILSTVSYFITLYSIGGIPRDTIQEILYYKKSGQV